MSGEANTAVAVPPALPQPTEQAKTVEQTKTGRKPRLSAEQKNLHVAACKDLNTKGVADYAKQHGLSPFTLRSWIYGTAKPSDRPKSGKRGRPKGSKNKTDGTAQANAPKRGRPKGSGKRGRPKGSKNQAAATQEVMTNPVQPTEFSAHCKEQIKSMILANTNNMLEGKPVLPATTLDHLNSAFKSL